MRHFSSIAALCALAAAPLVAADEAVPPQTKMIDAGIQQGWADFEVRPSAEAADGIWLRRLFLDVIGRTPTLDELTAFERNRSDNKKVEIVEALLNDDRYTEEYAAHWATIWCNILIGRSGGTDNDSLTSREGMLKYLRDAFARNKPYNELVWELTTATGATKPGTEDFNGAVNYLVEKVNEEDATLATSHLSRTFLGLQVQCTQCHNHPFNQWKQQKFWEFNAFFRQTRALRRFVPGTRDVDHAELVDQDFAGEAGDPTDAVIFFELRNGLTRAAYPTFVDGTELSHTGYVDEVNRRQELGKLILQSPFVDKMIVNRMWAHFNGYGFTKPIDDLGPHNPPSHPRLLEELAAEFRKNSYDLRKLITWIALSEPYSLDSRPGRSNANDDPALGEPPKFSRFYPRQMSAEQLYQSLVTTSGAASSGSYEEQERARQQWLQQFVVAFGNDEGTETTTFNGSIPQALMMFNGELIRRATSDAPGTLIGELVRDDGSVVEDVHGLFLAGLGRRATRDELTMANKLYVARERNEAEMLQDMWWAIINSNEFILIH